MAEELIQILNSTFGTLANITAMAKVEDEIVNTTYGNITAYFLMKEDHEEEEPTNLIGLIIIKIICMFAIFVVAMIFGLLPLKTLSMKYRSRIATVANCFGGGVFFGTCFLHLIPEVKMQLDEYGQTLGSKLFNQLPVAEFLECTGFLLILSIEKIAESAKKVRPFTQRFSVFISTKKLSSARKIVQQQELEAIPDGCEGCHDEIKNDCDDCNDEDSEQGTDRKSSMNSQQSNASSLAKRSSCDKSPKKGRKILPEAFLSAMKDNLYKNVPNRGPQEDPVPGDTAHKSVFLLIMALSIHSFFEGLAIGVERFEAVFLQLAAAITVHKCVIAFAVGSRLIHSGKNLASIIMHLGIMCIMTPVGVTVAILIVRSLQEETETLLIVSGSIQGVSTGFFLYITFAEMLFQEMKSKQDSMLKVSFMTLGVLIVTASTIWHNMNGAHAHGGGDEDSDGH